MQIKQCQIWIFKFAKMAWLKDRFAAIAIGGTFFLLGGCVSISSRIDLLQFNESPGVIRFTKTSHEMARVDRMDHIKVNEHVNEIELTPGRHVLHLVCSKTYNDVTVYGKSQFYFLAKAGYVYQIVIYPYENKPLKPNGKCWMMIQHIN